MGKSYKKTVFNTDDLDGEIWKDIEGYEGFYRISNLGRVKSCLRMVKSMCSGVHCVKASNEKILKPINRKGYIICNLSKEGKPKVFLTHRLIAAAFIPNHLGKPFVNHIDGNKSNNSIENLEWCTPKENCVHAAENDLLTLHWVGIKGKDHPKSKPIMQCDLSGNVIKVWESATVVNGHLKFNRCKIQECARGLRENYYGFIWKYLKVA